jgi:2-oxoglutarate dehydrogenase E2 component (dihydrolipoamide succinyltransferase)
MHLDYNMGTAHKLKNIAGDLMLDIVVPVMGESVAEGSIGSWSKNAGDAVKKDELLVEIETDKVALEVVAPADGVLAEVLAGAGDTVTPGMVIARIEAGATGKTAAPPMPATVTADPAPTPAPTPAPAPAPTKHDPMPAAAHALETAGLSSTAITGTGKDGRVTKSDALAAVAALAAAPVSTPAPVAVPATPRATGAREERVKMTRLRQTIARRLKDAQNTAAMLTTFNEVDMTEIMAVRNKYKDIFEKKHGTKLGFMSFFVKACIVALKDVPAVNAEIDGTDLIYKNHYDIAVAVGTDKGLVVPVLRDADGLGLAGIEKGIADLGKKARDGALSIEDMQGGTFTISNGGVYGSLMSTPILNAPQSGILGMHKIQDRPMVVGGQIMVRPMMYLALSYDHRIVDGKEAVTFLVRVKECLEDPERMLLDV